MSHPARFFIVSIIAFALPGAGALLFSEAALALGGREKPPEIVHGRRAFEKPYLRPFDPGNWEILETKIDDDLTDVRAVDADHAWAAGVSGGLYRTSDGGETWKPLVGVDYARFAQILWMTAERGFALTREGEVVRTDDGGTVWKTLRARASGRVRHLDFVTPDRGWAVGAGGLILHTGDGGVTWSRQHSEGGSDLDLVQMISAETGWAGGSGVLLGTRDGGTHWSALESRAGWRFVSGKRGYASDDRAIHRTKDGGKSWKRICTAEELMARADESAAKAAEGDQAGTPDPRRKGGGQPFIGRVQFVDRYNGIAEILRDRVQLLLRSRSLGRTWKLVHDAGGSEAGELVNFVMSDGRNGLAIDSRGGLRATGDGARTWPLQIRSEDFDLTDVRFADREHGWAVGATGRILVTDDGGGRWREAARRLDTPFMAVATGTLPSGRVRAWAAGGGGRVAVSSPEGQNWRSPWRVQATTTRQTIHGLDIYRARRGIAAGEEGLVIVTEDGGARWERRNPGITETLRAAVQVNESLSIVAGGRSFLISRDGALTFSQVVPQTFLGGGTIVSADAPDERHLFALQSEGYVLRSADGGETWERTKVGGPGRLSKVQFLDPSHGWILGRTAAAESVLYSSQDGGKSWDEAALPRLDARSFHFVDQRSGWLVAPQAVLHSMDGGRNWRRQRVAPSRFIRAFALLPQGGAWAVGDNGFAARHLPVGGPQGQAPAAQGDRGASSPRRRPRSPGRPRNASMRSIRRR